MLAAHIGAVLTITGLITALPGVLYAAPAPVLRRLLKLELADRGSLFIARHWALVVFAVGALLVHAAGRPEVRSPVMLAALVEKVGLIALVAAQWSEPHTRGLRIAAAFDVVCGALYAAWLLGA